MQSLTDAYFKKTGQRPTWAEVNLDGLTFNFHHVREKVGPDVNVMAVVKADAYGHGAIPCARRLVAQGANYFGVALPEEGIELRTHGVSQSIICLAGFWFDQAAACIQHKLTPAVFRLDQIAALDAAARDAGVIVDMHLKIDTGMGRLGVRFDEFSEFVDQLGRFRNVRVDGLMTHFAAADDPSCQPLTEVQIQRFADCASILNNKGHRPSHFHLANSAGVFGHRRAWGNMVRPGGVLYGLWRDVLPPMEEKILLRPVMSLYSRVNLLKWVPQGETVGYGCTFEASRKTLVATLPVGYHDGYMRGLSNRGKVIIRGLLAPVIGRVSMDLTLIDVTNVPGVELHDEVTLLGHDHSGSNLSIAAEDMARIVGTLSYEVTCGVSDRVPRVFV